MILPPKTTKTALDLSDSQACLCTKFYHQGATTGDLAELVRAPSYQPPCGRPAVWFPLLHLRHRNVLQLVMPTKVDSIGVNPYVSKMNVSLSHTTNAIEGYIIRVKEYWMEKNREQKDPTYRGLNGWQLRHRIFCQSQDFHLLHCQSELRFNNQVGRSLCF